MLSDKKIRKIIEENKEYFKALEEYDKTHKLPTQRVRIDITISNRVLDMLKKARDKTGKPISRIIEEALSNKE